MDKEMINLYRFMLINRAKAKQARSTGNNYHFELRTDDREPFSINPSRYIVYILTLSPSKIELKWEQE